MDVLIVGAGGHGRVVLEILRLAGQHRPVGFIDADAGLAGTDIAGLPVFGHINTLPKLRQQKIRGAIVAIGDANARISYAKALHEHGFELVNAIHPSALISPTARLGTNIVVAAGAVISTDATIDDHAIINTAAVVDHECRIGQAVHLAPGCRLAGRVTVESHAMVGLGASVIQCLTVGQRAMVGAGAVVIRDVPAGTTVVGVPARVIRQA